MRDRLHYFGMLALGASALLHLVVGSATGLSVDEAHYLLYARYVDWSYFDHPPLVGWVQIPWVMLNAPTPLVRLLPQVLWLATFVLLFKALQITVSQYPNSITNLSRQRHAVGWLFLLFAASPLLQVVSLALLPDTLLGLWVAGLVLWMVRIQQRAHVSWSAWVVLGLLLGLSGLSKYTAIFVALGVVAWLVVSGYRPHRAAGGWLALAIAIAIAWPVFAWNLERDWISLRYQSSHVGGEGWSAPDFIQFIFIQLILAGPPLLVGLVIQLRRGLNDPQNRLLWLWAIPFVALAWLAGGGRSLPYWTTPAWVAVLPLAAMGLAQVRSRALRILVFTSLALQGILLLWVSVSLIVGHPVGGKERQTPLSDLHGWDLAAQQLERVGAARGVGTIVVLNWTHASRLAWHAPSMSVKPLDDRFDQFDIWFGHLQPNESALVFVPLGTPLPDQLEVAMTHRTGTNAAAEGRFTACGRAEAVGPHLMLHCREWQWLTPPVN